MKALVGSFDKCRRMSGGVAPRACIGIVVFGCAIGLPAVLAQPVLQTRTVEVVVSRIIPAATCASEPLSLSGTLNLLTQTNTGPNGAKQTSVVTDLKQVQASGGSSQAVYSLDNQSKERQNFGCGPGEQCLTGIIAPFTVVGLGPPNTTAGTLLIRLNADPKGNLTGNLADARFTCKQ